MTAVWALTWLGQCAALAALTAAFVRLPGCRQDAATRHVAWGVALFLCAGLLALMRVPADFAAPALRSVPGASAAQPSASGAFVLLPAEAARAFWWLGWVWAVGAAAGLAMLGRDVWRLVRLKRRTVPLHPEDLSRLGAGLVARMPSRDPGLAWCDELDSPAVLGFSRPLIALPRSQVSRLSDAQSQLVVLHELAHVSRGDDWWVLAERIIVALTWVNPVVHWVRRELSLAREMACDEWVVRQTAAPAAYARCLADVAALRTQERRLRLAAGVTGRPGALRRRIVGVLALDGRRSTRALAVSAWLAPVAVCVVAAGLLRLPPVIGVRRPADATHPAAVWSGPIETGDGVSAGRPPGQLNGIDAPVARRSAPARRRSSELEATPARLVTASESLSPGQPGPEPATVEAEASDLPPLAASPVPGAGAPGVAVAAGVQETFPLQAGSPRWWSGPAAIASATGGAAATAGRATASTLVRLGSRVPQLLKR